MLSTALIVAFVFFVFFTDVWDFLPKFFREKEHWADFS